MAEKDHPDAPVEEHRADVELLVSLLVSEGVEQEDPLQDVFGHRGRAVLIEADVGVVQPRKALCTGPEEEPIEYPRYEDQEDRVGEDPEQEIGDTHTCQIQRE